MKIHKINGISVYDFEGTGRPLIFVHAFPLCAKMWESQVNYFKEKYRVITYDVRGLGDSISGDWQFTMESYADDFIEIIKQLKLDPVAACGLSMGGYIIQRALVKNPVLFKAIVLADTRAERDDDAGLISRSNSITSIKNGLKDEFISGFLQKLISEKSLNTPAIKNCIESMMLSNSDEGICGAMIALATRTTTLNQLQNINVPALIIVGEDDILTPLVFAQSMNKSLKNSELVVIKNSGHMTNIEQPEDFNKTLEIFLKKL